MWHYIYWYIIAVHPVYWLYNKALEYEPLKLSEGIWLVLAVFGIAAWFGLTRFLAEVPGRKHGNTYFWWIIISVFHVWSIIVFLIYYPIASAYRHHYKSVRMEKFSDRSKAEIWASSDDDKQTMRSRSRRK